MCIVRKNSGSAICARLTKSVIPYKVSGVELLRCESYSYINQKTFKLLQNCALFSASLINFSTLKGRKKSAKLRRRGENSVTEEEDDEVRCATAAEENRSRAMHPVAEMGTSVPAFLGKLWRLVEDPETDDLICWSPVSVLFFFFFLLFLLIVLYYESLTQRIGI